MYRSNLSNGRLTEDTQYIFVLYFDAVRRGGTQNSTQSPVVLGGGGEAGGPGNALVAADAICGVDLEGDGHPSAVVL